MAWDTGEPIIFGHPAQIVLAVILADGLDVPVNEDLIEVTRDGGRLYQFMVGGAYP